MRACMHTQVRRVVTALSVSVFLVSQKRNIIRDITLTWCCHNVQIKRWGRGTQQPRHSGSDQRLEFLLHLLFCVPEITFVYCLNCFHNCVVLNNIIAVWVCAQRQHFFKWIKCSARQRGCWGWLEATHVACWLRLKKDCAFVKCRWIILSQVKQDSSLSLYNTVTVNGAQHSCFFFHLNGQDNFYRI